MEIAKLFPSYPAKSDDMAAEKYMEDQQIQHKAMVDELLMPDLEGLDLIQVPQKVLEQLG